MCRVVQQERKGILALELRRPPAGLCLHSTAMDCSYEGCSPRRYADATLPAAILSNEFQTALGLPAFSAFLVGQRATIERLGVRTV